MVYLIITSLVFGTSSLEHENNKKAIYGCGEVARYHLVLQWGVTTVLSSITDEELVARVIAEPALFAHLIARYEAKLQRYIARLGVRDFEDQQDVLQEIFLKAYRNLNGFDQSLSFSSWIYRIAHNEAVSWYRRRKVRPEGSLVTDSDEVLGWLAAAEESAEQRFDQAADATRVNEALARLDPKYRDVLLLRYFEHKEYDEISDILRIPVGSVGTLLHRGKKQLRSVLNTLLERI